MEQKKELTKKTKDEIVDMTQFEGLPTGFEDTTNETFKTPFVKILQALSPEKQKKNEKYVDGAEEGMFFNTATGKLSEELEVIVLKISHDLVVWQPDRGGFVGSFSKTEESEIVDRRDGAKKFDKDGNEVMDTISFFCADVNDPGSLFVFPMSASALKHARNWSTRLRTLKIGDKAAGYVFAGVWKIGSVLESNDKGSWYSIGNTPTFIRPVTNDEVKGIIVPGLEILKKAKTDYSVIDDSGDKEETKY